MEEFIAPILFLLVIGGVSGYFMGKLFKRASGMALTIVILAFLVAYLVFIGTIDLNIDSIFASVGNFFNLIAPLGIIAIVSSVPFAASFVAGIFVGFRRH